MISSINAKRQKSGCYEKIQILMKLVSFYAKISHPFKKIDAA